MPNFFGLAADTPEWVEKLEAGIGHDLFKPAKSKDAAKMSLRRCGSTLGNLKGLAEWLEEWFEAECKDLEEKGPHRSVNSLLVVAHAEVLQRLAGRGGSRVQDQATDGKRLTSPMIWLRLTLADLENAARKLYLAESEQGKDGASGINAAMVGLSECSDLGNLTSLAANVSWRRTVVSKSELDRIWNDNGDEFWRQVPGFEDAQILFIDWMRLFDDAGTNEDTIDSERASPLASAYPEPTSDQLRYGYADLRRLQTIATSRRSLEDPHADVVAIPMCDAGVWKRAMEDSSRLFNDFLPGVRKLTAQALHACADLSHDEMQEFLRGFIDGHSRKPHSLKVGELGYTDFEIKLILIMMWPWVEKLQSIRQLHDVLVRLIGTYRAGTLKRIEKMSQRIGLHLARTGRPRESS